MMFHPSSSEPRGIGPRKRPLVFFVGLLAAVAGCNPVAPPSAKTHSAATQVSTYSALQLGLFDGEVTYAQLEQAGDFGIGTFNGLDGEMIALDGKFYQAKDDGSVHRADKSMKTPFATVHFFRSKRRTHVKEPLPSYDQLKNYLAQRMPTANRPYAFKIHGTFSYLKLRSVPKQRKPFPPLADVIARQTTFERQNITGTMVGYWMPQYLAGINVPGYHFHFISDDQKHAGHVLQCSLTEATVDVDYLQSVTLQIPQTAAFQDADFTKSQK